MVATEEEGKAAVARAREEEKVLKRWNEIKAFEQCLKDSKDKPPYIFYDGPPFATGTPHYGHILAGTIKDIVCRYQHQRGKYVHRRWGWDCHGVPVEFEIDKKFNFKGRLDVLNFGIADYNEECRSIDNIIYFRFRFVIDFSVLILTIRY